MSPARSHKKSHWLQASGVLFAMTMGSNLANYVFHAIASRSLGPTNYGAFVSMLALIMVMGIPSQTIQTVLARRFAVDEILHQYDRIYSTAYHTFGYLLLLGGGLALGLALASPFLKNFFHLPAITPVVMVAITTLVMMIMPVIRGLLQGLQRFRALGINTLVDGLMRLGVGTLLLALGMGVSGAIFCSALSALTAFGLAYWYLSFLRKEPLQPASELELGPLYQAMIPVMAAFGAYLILSSLDMLMVKHYFPGQAAGYYSAGSMVGKCFLFLPLAIAQVLLPKVSAGASLSEDTRHLLDKSILITGGILLAGIMGVWFLVKWVVLTLFGAGYINPQTMILAQWFGVAISPLALLYILLLYNLAIHNLRFIILLCLDIPVLLLLLFFFHSSLEQVLFWVGVNHSLLFVLGYLVTPRK